MESRPIGVANSKLRKVVGQFIDRPTLYEVKESFAEPPYTSLNPGMQE